MHGWKPRSAERVVSEYTRRGRDEMCRAYNSDAHRASAARNLDFFSQQTIVLRRNF